MSVPVCHCGSQALVLFPGDEGSAATLWAMNKPIAVDTFTMRRPIAGFGLCEPHARERGWPNYRSEQQKKRRVA